MEFSSGRTNIELRWCQEVLRELKKPKHWHDCHYFYEPVDPVLLSVPAYPLVIKKPMEMRTMQEKLTTGQYGNARDFEVDIRLIFENSCKFNDPGETVYNAGERVLQIFEAKWAEQKAWRETHECVQSPDEGDEKHEIAIIRPTDMVKRKHNAKSPRTTHTLYSRKNKLEKERSSTRAVAQRPRMISLSSHQSSSVITTPQVQSKSPSSRDHFSLIQPSRQTLSASMDDLASSRDRTETMEPQFRLENSESPFSSFENFMLQNFWERNFRSEHPEKTTCKLTLVKPANLHVLHHAYHLIKCTDGARVRYCSSSHTIPNYPTFTFDIKPGSGFPFQVGRGVWQDITAEICTTELFSWEAFQSKIDGTIEGQVTLEKLEHLFSIKEAL